MKREESQAYYRQSAKRLLERLTLMLDGKLSRQYEAYLKAQHQVTVVNLDIQSAAKRWREWREAFEALHGHLSALLSGEVIQYETYADLWDTVNVLLNDANADLSAWWRQHECPQTVLHDEPSVDHRQCAEMVRYWVKSLTEWQGHLGRASRTGSGGGSPAADALKAGLRWLTEYSQGKATFRSFIQVEHDLSAAAEQVRTALDRARGLSA
jgi:hypothetical protein